MCLSTKLSFRNTCVVWVLSHRLLLCFSGNHLDATKIKCRRRLVIHFPRDIMTFNKSRIEALLFSRDLVFALVVSMASMLD